MKSDKKTIVTNEANKIKIRNYAGRLWTCLCNFKIFIGWRCFEEWKMFSLIQCIDLSANNILRLSVFL
jgi:hypothetical protein